MELRTSLSKLTLSKNILDALVDQSQGEGLLKGRTMTDEMKPVRCGCGGDAKIELLPFEVWDDMWDASASQYLVRCDGCGVTTRLHDTEAEAVTSWNRAMSGNVQYVAVFGDMNAPKSKTVG